MHWKVPAPSGIYYPHPRLFAGQFMITLIIVFHPGSSSGAGVPAQGSAIPAHLPQKVPEAGKRPSCRVLVSWHFNFVSTPWATREHPMSYLWAPYELPLNTLWGTCEHPIGYLWPPYELPVSTLWATCEHPMSHLWAPYELPVNTLFVTLTFKGSSYWSTMHDQTDDFHRVMIGNLVRSSQTPKVHQYDHKIISLNRLKLWVHCYYRSISILSLQVMSWKIIWWNWRRLNHDYEHRNFGFFLEFFGTFHDFPYRNLHMIFVF